MPWGLVIGSDCIIPCSSYRWGTRDQPKKEKFFLVLTEANDMIIAPHVPGELCEVLQQQYPKAAVVLCKESEVAEMEVLYVVKNGKRIRTEVGPYLACYYEYEIDE